jgi:hypothetical protein
MREGIAGISKGIVLGLFQMISGKKGKTRSFSVS